MMSVFFIVLTALMALVIYLDATRYIIPNWLNGLVLALYPVFALLAPEGVDLQAAGLTLLGVFAFGFVLFALRLMGGGDIKLLAALSPWCAYPAIVEFLIWMTIYGGLLSLVLIIARVWLPRLLPSKVAKLPRMLQSGQPVPYGLAIAASFLLLLWKQKLPGLILA
jgi:prepilin peptidase CpaA